MLLLLLFAAEVNTWERLPDAVVHGRRWDVSMGHDPAGRRFLILGGRSTWADYKKPRSYDVLSLDGGRWRNDFPAGAAWGPESGPCEAPPWKDERWGFRDVKGNVRPNWTVYGTFSLGTKFDYDHDAKAFVFYAGGRTFRYDPAARAWADLAPKTHPDADVGGHLLWSSMAYDRERKQFTLFGGGNSRTPRGDPGTWTFSSASNEWKKVDGAQPPQRANSRLAYDPERKVTVLFGGDRLDALLSDTWTFDGAKWTEVKAGRSPSPRAGHALLWLPKAKRLLLLGGYGFTSATGYVASLYRPLPVEAWAFDGAKWRLVKRFDKDAPVGPANAALSAAVGEDDTVVVHGTNGTWRCTFDVSIAEEAGVEGGTVERRTGPHDPAWYQQDVPPADPAAVKTQLAALPANKWVLRPTPKLPRPNVDWGSAVFDPIGDRIVRFSGGHSAYSGTAPHVYHVATDRYSLPFAPEYPIDYVYSNDQVDGEWSFQGRPWMTGHTYKATGYDGGLLFVPHEYSYVFDADKGAWTRSAAKNPFRPNFYTNTVVSTPDGPVVWAEKLWRRVGGEWKPMPLSGGLHETRADEHGLAFDAKRGRLLFFSGVGKLRGEVIAYADGVAKPLGAKGRTAVPSRETVYVPDLDAVLIGARVKVKDGFAWVMYDCARNAYRAVEFGGADPIAKGAFNNSMGLMYDPNRRLVWAVGQNGHVHVLRPDPKTWTIHELE